MKGKKHTRPLSFDMFPIPFCPEEVLSIQKSKGRKDIFHYMQTQFGPAREWEEGFSLWQNPSKVCSACIFGLLIGEGSADNAEKLTL